jgi:glutamate dehydrogenase
MLLEAAAIVEHAAAWLLQRRQLDLTREPVRLGAYVRGLGASLGALLPPRDRALADERAGYFAQAGVPAPLAPRIGAMMFLAPALDIGELAERAGRPLERAAQIYYEVGVRFALDEMRAAARRLQVETQWQKLAAEAVIDDMRTLQADLAAQILTAEATGLSTDPVAAWSAAHAAELAPADALARELRASVTPDLALLVVGARQLRQLLG